MQAYPDMRFGMFIPPLHANNEHPTMALERDLELVQLLDKWDYDEVWVGEHHSTGIEIIASPELFIAAAAQRTRRIRMGTGVNSLCFHHPFMLAERIVQLDHLTHGRVMFGVGPGQLPGDAYMLGIDPADQRRMMGEALDSIIPLLRGETVTRETDWFKLVEARLQILPYQHRIEMAAATALSPNGPSLAGKHGIGMLALTAGSPAGFALLNDHWRVCQEAAKEYGTVVDRRNWRVVASVHIAETREQALQEVHHDIMHKVEYYQKILGDTGTKDLNLNVHSAAEAVRCWTDSSGTGLGPFGIGIIGTPDDAIARIRQFQEQTGGFGCFLMFAHNAASWEATQRSVELFGRRVIPVLRDMNRNRAASLDWSAQKADAFNTQRLASEQKARDAYKNRKQGR
jgi:limonene 1,2-monooxygenase